MQILTRILSSLLLVGVLTASACAQAPVDSAPKAGEERRMPVPEYTVAFLATALIMLIVCAPSRRA